MLKSFIELEQQFSKRKPGSPEADKIAQAITDKFSALNLKTTKEQIRVYQFEASVLGFVIGSLAAIGAGFFFPQLGLVLEVVLWMLLLGEIKRPILARIKPGKAENLVVTIPAQSKETQKVILTAGYDTSDFMAVPLGLKPGMFWRLNLLLGLSVPSWQLVSMLLDLKFLTAWSLVFLGVMTILSILPKKSSQTLSGLNNCAILTELASILVRFRPSITTVVFCFTGAQSLNSGVQKLPLLFKGDSQVYGLNLVAQTRNNLGIVSQEGFIPLKENLLLKEFLTEVAKEKSIPTETIAISDITPSYPLLNQKLNVISIASPPEEPAPNLRELLAGAIRRLER